MNTSRCLKLGGLPALVLGLVGWSMLPLTTLHGAEAVYTGLKPDNFMQDWLVLGPVPISDEKAPDEAAQKKAFAEDWLAEAGGESGIRPEKGITIGIDGKQYAWRFVRSEEESIDLNLGQSAQELCIAYAAAEIHMGQATKTLLGLGSDDGVKVWLNGKLIHEHWTGRGAQPDDDVVPVEFREGKNQLLLKVQNQRGPWGFVCRLMGDETLGTKLVNAAGRGDLESVDLLLERGVKIDQRGPAGLTAYQSARLHGRKEVVDFLQSKGADTTVPMPSPETLVDALFRSVFKVGRAGAAVLVAKDGKILVEKGYGFADLGNRVPATPNTKFRIGSISKQFTAAAILKLAEEGKLSLQDTLAKFISDYPRANEVTIHHLLTHTSGIHSYTSKPGFLEGATVGVKPEAHIKAFQNDPYDFDPGQKWLYNNSGYYLLGYIIERASGKSYAEYLRQAFFDPLGMRDTGVHETTAILDDEAYGYSFENGKIRKAVNWDMSKAGAAGALYSTVRDLYRWNEAIFSGKVLKESSLKAAFTPVKTASDDPDELKETGYGYGWAIQTWRGLREISHGGGLNGFVSYLLRLPTENFTVAVLVNCAPPFPGADPSSLAHEIPELVLGDKRPAREVPRIDSNVSPASLEAIVGRYDYGIGIMNVTLEGKKVFAQLGSQPKLEIFPRSETNFFWKVAEAEVTFVKNERGHVTKALHRQGANTITAPRLAEIQEAAVDPKVYDQLLGRYDYSGAILTVTREGNRLFAQLSGQPKLEIFPKSEMEFFWKVVDAQVTFVKDQEGKITKAIHKQSGKTLEAPRLN